MFDNFTIANLTDLEISAILNALDEWDSTAANTAKEKIKTQTGMK